MERVKFPLDAIYDRLGDKENPLEGDLLEVAKVASPLCLAMALNDEIVAYPHARLLDTYIVALTELSLYPDGPGGPCEVWRRQREGRGKWIKAKGLGLAGATEIGTSKAEEVRYVRPGAGVDADPADTVSRRLVAVYPPRHSKSLLTTEHTPLWFLAKYPKAPILVATYSSDFAEKWGQGTKDRLSEFGDQLPIASDGLPLKALTTRLDHISFRPGKDVGEINYRGVGGAITGTGFLLGIIDDPFKDDEEALSKASQERKKNWYSAVFGNRKTKISGYPPPLEINIQTRWSENDLVGKFALESDNETPKPGYCVLRVPAISEPGGKDPLGRPPGRSLAPQLKSLDELIEERTQDPVWFSCLFQGVPTHNKGTMFKKMHVREGKDDSFFHYTYDARRQLYIGHNGIEIPASDASTQHFVTIDTANSKRTTADWTVISNWAYDPFQNVLILVDSVRDRVSSEKHVPTIREFLLRQRAEAKPGLIGIENKTFGTTLINDIRRDEPTWVIVPLKAEADKITRNTPYAVSVNTGHTWFPDPETTPWVTEWENEHAGFPRVRHDDQVDTGGYAYIHSRNFFRAGARPAATPEVEKRNDHVQRGIRQVQRSGGRMHPYQSLMTRNR